MASDAMSAMTSSTRGIILATASSSTPPDLMSHPSEEQHGFVAVLTLLFNFVWLLLSAIPGVLTFTTITIPKWLYLLFSMSLTFTMNFTTLLLIALAII